MRNSWLHLIAGLGMLGATSMVSANLVSNGSFESDSELFVGGSDQTMVLSSGSTVLTDWTVTGNDVAWLYDDYWGITASDGDYFLDLTTYSAGGSGGVAQSIISTVIGQSYELTFDFGSSTTYGASTSIIASAGSMTDTFYTTATSTNQWDAVSMIFTAVDTTTAIDITGVGTQYGGYYIGLDNVSVVATSTAVPEPSALALMGLGLTGLCFSRRKRRHAA